MKLEAVKILKLQYVGNIHISHFNNIQHSDIELAKKNTQILNIYKQNPNVRGKPSFKTIAADKEKILLNAEKIAR